jgi:hypothetical protein
MCAVRAYRQRTLIGTLVGTPGASHFSQVTHKQTEPVSPYLTRSPRIERRGATFDGIAPRGQPVSSRREQC